MNPIKQERNKINLSNKEKQEVIRRVDEGKLLPDKYRFLLFQDKKQVELVWNGKTFETTNLALPFQTIETMDEPREEELADEKSDDAGTQLGFFGEQGCQMAGWTNRLILSRFKKNLLSFQIILEAN